MKILKLAYVYKLEQDIITITLPKHHDPTKGLGLLGYHNIYNKNVTINISSSLKNNYLNSKPSEQKDSGRNHYNEEEEFKLMSHKRRPFPKARVGLGTIYQVDYFEEM